VAKFESERSRDLKGLAEGTGIPYQNLINLYLRECAADKKRLKLNWAA
jgi:hypothetical protein